MRKILSIIILLTLTATLLCGCSSTTDWLSTATANGDSYTISLGYDETNHIVTGVQTVVTTNNTLECITSVKMHLYANAYQQDAVSAVVPTSYYSVAYPNGTSYGNITIDSVYVNGTAVAYTIGGTDSDILSIPAEIMLGESATIELTYTINLANIAHRLGYTDCTVSLGNCYPILCAMTESGYDTSCYYSVGDPFVSDMANYDVTITLPNTYMVASTGTLTSSTANDLNTTHCYTANAVRDFAMVLSDSYQLKSTTVGYTTLYYYYYQDDTPEATLASILASYNYMTTNVGEYPYSQYTVAETDMCYGGMEYPNMVMASANTSQYITAVVHETVHQWFYGIIGNDQINNAWMDEGLTEFVTMLILDDSLTVSLADNIGSMYKAYTTYVDVLSNYYDDLDTSYRALGDYTNDQDYVYTVYVKGSIMFYNIYDTMGESKFLNALSQYYNCCAGTIATPQQMIDCFSSSFGTSMDQLFEAYMQGKDILYSQTTSVSTTTTDIIIC